ncbi:hypothetical protein [Streptomyces sp. NPDC088812]|uniref:hypothetical protein n=1 Tax=Streptomyces sp. NPDC088812 TaxID=3365905 RepID=UPI003815DFDF
MLLVFGIASVVSILVTGALVDRRLRTLTVVSGVLALMTPVLLVVLGARTHAFPAARPGTE